MHSASTSAGSPAPPPTRVYSNEPAWRHALDWFERANALAAREVRLALRSPRAWLLLSLYVSILGAVVLTQFPAGTSVEMWANGAAVSSDSSALPSSQRGQELLQTFALAQFFGVWLLVPSLAVGALHQEREGQTLESLLLSPLTPLQIVWGKLCGVLAMTFVLLLGTLPLTSLCFLLGGVAPEDVALRFFGLLAWAMFCAGVGLYCASRTTSVTKATVQAYGLSMVGLAVSCVMLGPGVALATVGLVVWIARQVANGVRASLRAVLKRPVSSDADGADVVVNVLTMLVIVAFVAVSWSFLSQAHLSMIMLTALLILPYGVYVSQLAVNAAQHELAKKIEPTAPKREAWRDLGAAWQNSLAPDTTTYSAAAAASKGAEASASTYAAQGSAYSNYGRPANVAVKEAKATYGVKGFLSETMNPIFARDLRHGVGGRGATLVRWGYGAVIATQLFLLLFLSNGGSANSDVAFLSGLIKLQVILVMMACAWLGARSIAPERETQTLQQLLTLPMPASRIIGGKIASVLYFSLYVLLAGLPALLMLPLAYLMSWSSALSTIALQCAWGLLAGAWGVFCSLRCGKTRRALVWSLGGVCFGLFGASAAQWAIQSVAMSGWNMGLSSGLVASAAQILSPLTLAESAVHPVYGYTMTAESTKMVVSLSSQWLSIGVTGTVAAILFGASARAFTNLARKG